MKNQLKILLFSVIFGFIATLFLHTPDNNISASTTEGIADKIMRFHVIANSDSDEDQALKLEVKSAVINYTSGLFTGPTTIEETRNILLSNKEQINAIAASVINKNGYYYDVSSDISHCFFPTKSYGDVTFPPGEYEAFRIVIGNGKGKNWWCVMYPPLCFIDASRGVLPDTSKKELQNILTDDEYDTITARNYREKKITFRFKYLKFLNSIF